MIRPLALFLTLMAGPALAAPTVVTDGILTNAAGMALYTFDKDAPGVSNCDAACLAIWPILSAEGGGDEGDYTVITRADGTKQWAFKGMPLYTFVKDTKPGDRLGDGVKGVWHLAKP